MTALLFFIDFTFFTAPFVLALATKDAPWTALFAAWLFLLVRIVAGVFTRKANKYKPTRTKNITIDLFSDERRKNYAIAMLIRLVARTGMLTYLLYAIWHLLTK